MDTSASCVSLAQFILDPHRNAKEEAFHIGVKSGARKAFTPIVLVVTALAVAEIADPHR